ncbi:MAG TPA: hypothetical protein VJZ27_20025 [Aggregatilineales bacterium]|nr:hypothetical protein [Aggregatilineales bacterium]
MSQPDSSSSGTTAKFLVTGAAHTGKSQFITTITGAETRAYGEVQINPDMKIGLFSRLAPPEPDWREVIDLCIGVVLMVDATRPDTFADVPHMIEIMRQVHNVPMIIAVNKQDAPGAHPPGAVRDHLPEDLEIKVFPCIATQKQSAENVLLALIYTILS